MNNKLFQKTNIPGGWTVWTDVNILPTIVSVSDKYVSPYRYVNEVEGLISIQKEDSSNSKVVVGGFAFDVILGEMVLKEKAVDLFDVYDLEQSYCDLYEETLVGNSGKYKPTALKALGADSAKCSKNVLFLYRLALLPEYRKIGLGRSVLRDILTQYSMGAGVAAVDPTPFSFTQNNIAAGSIPWDDVDWDEDWEDWVDLDQCRLHEPLGRFFANSGFVPVDGSRFMLARL